METKHYVRVVYSVALVLHVFSNGLAIHASEESSCPAGCICDENQGPYNSDTVGGMFMSILMEHDQKKGYMFVRYCWWAKHMNALCAKYVDYEVDANRVVDLLYMWAN